MSLNPQLYTVQVMSGRRPKTSSFPVPYAGEYICASRDQSHFKVEGDPRFKFSGGGQFFLTNYRVIFVPKNPTEHIQAIELPLLFIQDYDVSQPILGANNLHGTCKLVDDPDSYVRLKWKLLFTNGGMGTMVPLFFATINYIRVASRNQHYTQDVYMDGNHSTAAVQQEEQPAAPPPFVANAVVDPNDPTVVYVLAQPEMPQDVPYEPQRPKFPTSKKND